MPEPLQPAFDYPKESTSCFEISIAANYRDVYMVLMNIPERPKWLSGLQKVEQETPAVFVGSIHHCTFNDYQAIVSPIQMTITAEEITYAESCRIEQQDLSLAYEFIFRNISETTCLFHGRFLNTGKKQMGEQEQVVLLERMQQMAENLATHCEKMEASFFQ